MHVAAQARHRLEITKLRPIAAAAIPHQTLFPPTQPLENAPPSHSPALPLRTVGRGARRERARIRLRLLRRRPHAARALRRRRGPGLRDAPANGGCAGRGTRVPALRLLALRAPALQTARAAGLCTP